MIVCSCNVISDLEVEEAVLGLLQEDPWRLIVPGRVLHAIGRRGECCGCYPTLLTIIQRVTERFHHTLQTAEEERAAFLAALRNEHSRIERTRRARRRSAARMRRRTIAA